MGNLKEKNTKARKYILANCIEAIIGAIYLDQGYKKLKNLLKNIYYLEPKR